MANFRMHLGVAMIGGGLLAGGGWQAELWTFSQALPLVALTSLGGILPDIDSDNSHAVRLIFTLLALAVVALGALLGQDLRPGVLLAMCAGLYVGIRYGLSAVFKHFSVHRGIWHSLLASLACALAITALGYQVFSQAAWLAWAQGVALFWGAMIHLLLDECFSVDLNGARFKRSFGTAFKLYDYRHPLNSFFMLLLTLGLVPWLPPVDELSALLSQGANVLQWL